MLLLPLFSIFLNFVTSHNIEDESIKEHWSDYYVELCSNPDRYFAAMGQLLSFRLRVDYIDFMDIEVRSIKPTLVVVKSFATSQQADMIEDYLNEKTLEAMKVVGKDNEPSEHSGRRAKGVWVEHHETVINRLHQRMKRVFTLDPDQAESFLILKYGVHGHYAPHYDYLDENPPQDYWMKNYGNRLATFLLLVKTAEQGGGTVFPNLDLVVQPDKGDLIIWFNADSNNVQEDKSLHGACPILKGEKIAVSLWVRRFNQHQLTSLPGLQDSSYHPAQLFRFND